MPVISRNKPAFASSALYPAANANDSDYSTYWRSNGPGWLAYDLSSVPALNRGQVLLGWYNDPVTTPYDHTISGDPGYNNPGSYTIAVNPAPGGGSPPATGWVTVATVVNNRLHSRQHLVNMTGNNWIRINVTVVDGSSGNNDVVINMDVHDASIGSEDSWIFYADSVYEDGIPHEPLSGSGPNFSQLVHAARPAYFPAFEDGGIGYQTTTNGANYVPGWLPLFPGRYVVIGYGLADANACETPSVFYNNYVSIVQAVLGSGKVPVVATILGARTPNVLQCGPGLNAKIEQLYAAFPQVVPGPDLWGLFQAHPEYLSSDHLHPNAAGYVAFRQWWADAMVANVYGP